MAVEDILEVCKVTPPLGSASPDIYFPLTFFDLLCMRYSPSENIFFYDSTHHPESVLPKLKHSLSLTLKHFLPLSGNLVWPSSSSFPGPFIHYKDGDGVVLTVSVTDSDFDHLTSKDNRDCRVFRPLVARIIGSNSLVPVCTVKISDFPNRGFCIGVTEHHVLFDAKSLELFMRSWASFSKFGENKKELTPVFDRKLVREQYLDIENSYIEFLKRNGVAPNRVVIRDFEPPPDTIRCTFELSGLDVRKLKEHIRARLVREYSHDVPYISTFAVAYAYVVLCLVKAKEVATIDRVRVGFAYNCRGRLVPPLPPNYVGNCIGTCGTYYEREDLFGTDFIIVVTNFIIKSIKDLENGAVRGAKEWLPDLSEADMNRKILDIFVAGSSKFKFESVDFGWGKPKKVDPTLIDGKCGVYFSDRDREGIKIGLSLARYEMENFTSLFARGLNDLVKHRSAAL